MRYSKAQYGTQFYSRAPAGSHGQSKDW